MYAVLSLPFTIRTFHPRFLIFLAFAVASLFQKNQSCNPYLFPLNVLMPVILSPLSDKHRPGQPQSIFGFYNSGIISLSPQMLCILFGRCFFACMIDQPVDLSVDSSSYIFSHFYLLLGNLFLVAPLVSA